MPATRTLEYARIVDAVTALALTPLGASALAALEPSTDPREVAAAQRATTETVAYLDRHPLFPLRAAADLPGALAGTLGPRKAPGAARAACARRLRRLGRADPRRHHARLRGVSRAERPGRSRCLLQ